jgi:integrase
MPFALVSPKAGRSPYWRVRGTEFGVYLNRSTKTGDRRIAAKFLAEWRAEAQRQVLSGGGESREPTFADAALAYMRADRSPRFLTPLLKHFGETPLSKIGQSELDAAAVALYPRASAQTRNRQVYSPVSAILRHSGVHKPIRRPKGSASAPRPHWLKPEQAFALLNAAAGVDARFGALLTFLLYCGPRLSEALRLEWPDVDLARSTALLRQTKNGQPITVHLPPQVVAALASLTPAEPTISHSRRQLKPTVFRITKCGRLYSMLAAAEKAAGLSLPPRSAFHILRHTHATWRRLYSGADTSALVQTGLWKSRNAAAIYEHIDVSEEARKSDLLPTPTRAKSARKAKS